MGMIQGYLSVSKPILEQLKQTTSIEENFAILGQVDDAMDIDKTWQFLNFLLTSSKYGSEHFINCLFYPKNSTLTITDEESN